MVAALAVGFYYFYFAKTQPEGGASGAIEAISTTGVKNDLIAIANAERAHFAEHGTYATLDELLSSGALQLRKLGRDGYAYAVEASGSGFTVTARYSGPAGLSYPTLVIDQTMQIRESR